MRQSILSHVSLLGLLLCALAAGSLGSSVARAAAGEQPSGASPSASPDRGAAPGGGPEAGPGLGVGDWPSGDRLRRELQDVGFIFRVDRESRAWRGWVPGTPLDGPAHLRLGPEGAAPAWIAVEFDLLAVEARRDEVDAALTGLLEAAARLPLPGAEVHRTFTFLTEDVLATAPSLLGPCAATSVPGGVIVVRFDVQAQTDATAAAATAAVLLARSAQAADPEASLADCGPIAPASEGPAPGEPSSERVTIGTGPGRAARFDPAEVTLEGWTVTVVLTFRNQSSSEMTLTFREPLDADTGPVPAGEERLIVLRRLEPGEYEFFSATEPADRAGLLRIVEPGS